LESKNCWRADLRQKIDRFTGRAVVYVLLVLFGIVFVVPLVWLIGSSFKEERQVMAFPPQFVPNPFVWGNYPKAISKFPFWVSARNTILIVLGVMVGHLFTCSFTAYIFARMRFPFRDALFVLVLSTMMIPYHVYLIPQYILFRILGWLNSAKPLIVPHLLGQAPFFIFLLRQFFRTIPREYDDAARIDGCGWFDIYRRIMLPQALPALGTTAIFTFMGTWNDFLAPLIYLNEPKKQTLAIAIRTWTEMKGSHVIEELLWTDLMAISVMIALPPMLVFFFAQRYFIQGVVISGVKG
jgi:ABC-type glycerol-3-phosphate transport system permease component